MMGLVNILVTLLVLVIVLGCAWWGLRLLALPEPAAKVAAFLLYAVGVVMALAIIFGGVPLLHVRSF